MAPRSKRARVSSTSNGGDDVASTGENLTSNLKPHETLWFEDGNVVLATDVHLYCVHRGVLAKNSPVFRGMLERRNIGGERDGNATGELSEGKPLFRMVGDSDEDVCYTLMTLYDVRFFSAYRCAPWPVVLSLLRMSTKYDCLVTVVQNENSSASTTRQTHLDLSLVPPPRLQPALMAPRSNAQGLLARRMNTLRSPTRKRKQTSPHT